MYLYRVLRTVTLGLRAVQLAAIRASLAVRDAAETTAGGAKAAALASLERQEDKAYDALSATKRETEDKLAALLAREDLAIEHFQDVCYTNSSIRHRILNEVL
jgi:hypothetical protein